MNTAHNKFYSTVSLVLFGGLFYLGWNMLYGGPAWLSCWFKKITNLPCAACGTSRSIQAIFNQEYSASLLINPLGVLSLLLMLFATILLLLDLLSKKILLYQLFQKIEFWIKKPMFYLPLLVILLANWGWNIQKGL